MRFYITAAGETPEQGIELPDVDSPAANGRCRPHDHTRPARFVALRHAMPCLTRRQYHPIRARDDVLAYRRSLAAEQILVLLNIAGDPRRWDCDAPVTACCRPIRRDSVVRSAERFNCCPMKA